MIAIVGLFLSRINISNDIWNNLAKCITNSATEEKEIKENLNSLKKTKNESIENITKNVATQSIPKPI